jgi:hypothetical protein
MGDARGWAAGGKLIVFSPRWGDTLSVMRADGTHRRNLGVGADYADVSPSGRLVAGMREDADHVVTDPRSLVLSTLERTHVKTFQLPVDVEGPQTWAPDGRAITFSWGRSGTVVLDIRTGATHVLRQILNPTWSPDSRRLASLVRCPGRPVTSPPCLLVMQRDGKRRLVVGLRLGRGLAATWSPLWSPDGSRLAFVARRPLSNLDSATIYVVRPDGTGLRRVTQVPHSPYSMAWSPTSRELAFSSPVGIMTIGLNGGTPRRVTYRQPSVIMWAPASRILFSRHGMMFTVVPGEQPEPIRG